MTGSIDGVTSERGDWGRLAARRKTIASATVIALVAGVPLTVAALHPGLPGHRRRSRPRATSGSPTARSCSPAASTGRSTSSTARSPARIPELRRAAGRRRRSSSSTPTPTGSSRVDPAFTASPARRPAAGRRGALRRRRSSRSSRDGDLWALPVGRRPAARLRLDAAAARARRGRPCRRHRDGRDRRGLARPTRRCTASPTLADVPQSSPRFPTVGEYQLAAVGEPRGHPRRVDRTSSSRRTAPCVDARRRPARSSCSRAAPDVRRTPLRRHRRRAAARAARLAARSSELDAGAAHGDHRRRRASPPRSTSTAAPTAPGPHAQRTCSPCEGQEPAVAGHRPADRGQPPRVPGEPQRSIALNNLTNGNVWLPAENMRLVDNWDEVTPPERGGDRGGGRREVVAAVLRGHPRRAHRREPRRRPPSTTSSACARAAPRSSPVLDNDSDPDGDVLVDLRPRRRRRDHRQRSTSSTAAARCSSPRAEGFVGHASASATRSTTDAAAPRPPTSRRASCPTARTSRRIELRRSAVERRGQPDRRVQRAHRLARPRRRRPVPGRRRARRRATWCASPPTASSPSRTRPRSSARRRCSSRSPTARQRRGRPAPSSSTSSRPGSLSPIGTPDFATAFATSSSSSSRSSNDLSPSGAPLALTAIEDPGERRRRVARHRRRTRCASPRPSPGIYYFKYTLQAGPAPSVGIIRVDVLAGPRRRLAAADRRQGHRLPARRRADHGLGAHQRREPDRTHPRRAVGRLPRPTWWRRASSSSCSSDAHPRHLAAGAHRAGELHLHDLRRRSTRRRRA